jgi:hypothetical protein
MIMKLKKQRPEPKGAVEPVKKEIIFIMRPAIKYLSNTAVSQ